ncbi:MAG: efflux RND transporter periplasmic adaptor subunit [Verrucomicrobia bacterium]|jgi:RND family efflux transporter MFP subunit|nr:efflux RND transporter periplasmic adaptor subunit [Verrucomicrobiota bacterium]
MKRKLILFPVLVLAVCILLTVVLVKFGRQVQPVETEPYAPFVEVSEVVLAPKKLVVESQGTVVAATRIPLISELDGVVTEVSTSFREGGVFQRGDILLRIDDTDYKTMVAQARSQVATARVQYETIQAEAQLARKDWMEMEGMDLGTPTPLLFREPQLEGARAALAFAESALEKANKDVERTVVRAPFTGRLVSKIADLGQFVRRGQELARIFDVSKVEVKLPIPVSELAFLDPFLSSIKSDKSTNPVQVDLLGNYAGQERHWVGYVQRISGEIDVKSRMISLIAVVDDPYGLKVSSQESVAPLAVGMFVKARIHGRVLPEAFSLPRAAVIKGDRVIILDETDSITFRGVSIARFEGSEAVVKAGLKTGDRVCISRIEIPKEGSQVQPLGSDSEVQP